MHPNEALEVPFTRNLNSQVLQDYQDRKSWEKGHFLGRHG